jgi:predicted metal-binding membrane protein
VVVGVVVAGWVVVLVGEASGHGRLAHLGHSVAPAAAGGHAHPGHQGLTTVALVGFLVAWELMIVAMMLPSALPMIGLHASAAAAHERPTVVRTAFVGGYLVVWTLAGAIALAGAAGLHKAVAVTPELAQRPWRVAGALLVIAGAAQFLPLTQACLRACRHPYGWLHTRFRPGVAAAFRLGRDHGLYCLGCCWALMLVMFAAGVADLLVMAALTGVMVYEKVGRRGERLAAVVGVFLIAGGTLVMVHPPWLPPATPAMPGLAAATAAGAARGGT